MTLGAMWWRDLVFLHYEADPAPLRERLRPLPGIELDLHDGAAWVSVVALEVLGPMPGRVIGTRAAPALGYFQLNLRTYVTGADGPGIVLLHTRVDRILPLPARLLGLPYHRDRRLRIEQRPGGLLAVRGRDLAFALAPLADEPPVPLAPTGLGAFLLDRYVTYARSPLFGPLSMRVAHLRWELHPGVLEVAPAIDLPGVPPDAPPRWCHGAEALPVLVLSAARMHPERRALPAPA